MAKRKNVVVKEAAPAAAPQEPCCEQPCCEEPEFDLGPARAAIAAARSVPDVLAVVYGLPPAQRQKLYEDVAAARSRIMGVA